MRPVRKGKNVVRTDCPEEPFPQTNTTNHADLFHRLSRHLGRVYVNIYSGEVGGSRELFHKYCRLIPSTNFTFRANLHVDVRWSFAQKFDALFPMGPLLSISAAPSQPQLSRGCVVWVVWVVCVVCGLGGNCGGLIFPTALFQNHLLTIT